MADLEDVLIADGYLTLENADDRDAVGAAAEKFFRDTICGHQRHGA